MPTTQFLELGENNNLSILDKNFEKQPQIKMVVDTLRRSQQRLAIIESLEDEIWHTAFAESFTLYLNQENTVNFTHPAKIYYLKTPTTFNKKILDEIITTDTNYNIFIFSLTETTKIFAEKISELIEKNSAKSKIGFVLISHPGVIHNLTIPKTQYAKTTFNPINTNNIKSLLKNACKKFEKFHKVTFSENINTISYSLACRWLQGNNYVEKTLQLLDSAAAKISISSANTNPTVTEHTVQQIISDWSYINFSHIHTNQITNKDLTNILSRSILGQTAAIHRLSRILQTPTMDFEIKKGPAHTLLFKGPNRSGKHSLAKALAETICGHKNGLVIFTKNKNLTWIADKICQKPYAVILVKDIESYSAEIVEQLETIFTLGVATDSNNQKIDFRNTIMIFTSSISSSISPKNPALQPESELMQLVLGSQKSLSQHHETHLEESSNELPNNIPNNISQRIQTIAFESLDATLVQKIMLHETQKYILTIEKNLEIKFNLMPEAIEFLADAMYTDPNENSANTWLEKLLAPRISRYLAKNRRPPTNKHYLQVHLCGNGKTLVCEWASTKTITA